MRRLLVAGSDRASNLTRLFAMLAQPDEPLPWGALWAYGRLVRKARLAPHHTRPLLLAGMTVHYGQLPQLRITFREVFVRRDYDVRAAGVTRVIDAGANIGLASLFYAREHPNAAIACFEPDPINFEILQRNLQANRVNAEAHNVALSDRDGDMELFSLKGAPGDVGSSPSLELRQVFHPHERLIKRILPCRSLRPWLAEPVDILKLDIEGGEIAVLRDIRNDLGNVRHLAMEFHHIPGKSLLSDALAILETSGHRYQIVTATSNELGATALIHSYLI